MGSQDAQALVAHKRFLWNNGQTITVSFSFEAEYEFRKLVEDVAKTWENYANIRFEFRDQEKADIKIFSDHLQNPHSHLGINSRHYELSMNLPIEDLVPRIRNHDYTDRNYTKIRRIVLHEFGHALGFTHEHQNPSVSICWDEDAVFAICADGDDKTSCSNYLPLDHPNNYIYSSYDRRSIMHYEIELDLTYCDYSSPLNDDLSARDKRWASIIYPFPDEPSPQTEHRISVQSVSIEVADFEDEYGGQDALEIFGQISLTSSKYLPEECFTDLSNCHQEAIKYGIPVINIYEENHVSIHKDAPLMKRPLGIPLDIGPDDEYLLYVNIFEKDNFTSDDKYVYNRMAYIIDSDLFIPLEISYWKSKWRLTLPLSEGKEHKDALLLHLTMSIDPQ